MIVRRGWLVSMFQPMLIHNSTPCMKNKKIKGNPDLDTGVLQVKFIALPAVRRAKKGCFCWLFILARHTRNFYGFNHSSVRLNLCCFQVLEKQYKILSE